MTLAEILVLIDTKNDDNIFEYLDSDLYKVHYDFCLEQNLNLKDYIMIAIITHQHAVKIYKKTLSEYIFFTEENFLNQLKHHFKNRFEPFFEIFRKDLYILNITKHHFLIYLFNYSRKYLYILNKKLCKCSIKRIKLISNKLKFICCDKEISSFESISDYEYFKKGLLLFEHNIVDEDRLLN